MKSLYFEETIPQNYSLIENTIYKDKRLTLHNGRKYRRLSKAIDLSKPIRETVVIYASNFLYNKTLADSGDCNAQFKIGKMCYKGKECEKNFALATYYLTSGLSTQKNDYAIYLLGRIFHLSEKFKEALQHYTSIISEHFPKSNYRLGTIYENGQGVKRSLQKAEEHYQIASDHNHMKAAYRLIYLRTQHESTLINTLSQWVDHATMQQNAYDKQQLIQQIDGLSQEEQGHLHLWLTRLEKTAEFQINRFEFTKHTCEMIQAFFECNDFKMLAFTVMEFNNASCEDRPAMGFNEINLAYHLLVKATDANLETKIKLIGQAALTSATIDIISTLISQQEQKNTVKESAEIYLKMLIETSKSYPLLLGIHYMRYSQIGAPNWINVEMISEQIETNWLNYFISSEAFKNIVNKDEDFRTSKELLIQINQDKLASFEDSSEYYRQAQILKNEFDKQEAKLLKQWAFKLIREHCKNDQIQKLSEQMAADKGDIEAQYRVGRMYEMGKGCQRDSDKAFYYIEQAANQGHLNAQFNLGIMNYQGIGREKNFKQAFDYFKLVADQGNASAQFNLGLMYNSNEGCEKNLEQAFHYYKLAADQEHRQAQFNLGLMYYKGEGCEKNLEQALYYFELAADQGHLKAQYITGLIYDKGEGCEKNLEQALHYFKLAADQGDVDAQFNLGLMYGKGKGCEKNLEQAFHYFKLAADQDHVDAQFNLGLMYSKGEGCEKNLEQAIYYFELATDQGHPYAQFNLGLVYGKGEGCEKDLEQALYYFSLVINQVDTFAKFNLELMYNKGEGCEKNLEQAFYHFKLAADQGHLYAQKDVSVMYYKGIGCEKNFQQTFYYMKIAADRGHTHAQFELGLMYTKNECCEKNLEQAFYYMKRAADQDYINAQFNLSFMYKKGKGCEKNLEQAFYYMKQAADQGNVVAQYNTGSMYIKGKGCEKNLEQALHYYKLAADQGHVDAQNSLITLTKNN